MTSRPKNDLTRNALIAVIAGTRFGLSVLLMLLARKDYLDETQYCEMHDRK